jgi:transposase
MAKLTSAAEQAAEKLFCFCVLADLIICMRGDDVHQGAVFSYVSAEQRVAQDHPLRSIRAMVDEALSGLSGHFDTLYARCGRPSIAPEKLVRALLLQALYSVRSERQLMEQMDYNLLFRWFVGLNMDDPIWDVTVFTKNRERLIAGEVAERMLLAVVEQAHRKQLLSEEHFTVDGTLIQAWANRRSFKEKKDPPSRGTGSGGAKLLRDTHESTTDPEARLYKKATAAAAVPAYLGHVLTENRNGLVVRALATQASTTAEREAALLMLDSIERPGPNTTLGADKGYQQERFVEALRQRKVAPHVAEYEPNKAWPNFLTEAERNDPRMGISQSKRKLVEKVFGWVKLDRPLRQVKMRGLKRVDFLFRMLVTAQNLIRMRNLLATT